MFDPSYSMWLAATAADSQWLRGLSSERREQVLYARKMNRIRNKEQNMKDRIERREMVIWAQWWSRLWIVFLTLAAIPAALAVLGGLWRLALWVTIG